MEVSVVIPTLKSRDEIEAIDYLAQGEFDDYEVLIQNEYPVTKARNRGVRAADTDKIVFLDDDSRPREDYLSRVSETLEAEYALAGRTIHPRDDVFGNHLTGHYDFGDQPRYVDQFWGCNMALRKEALETVGGWDEKMGWGHEEKELANRITERYRIYYDPEAVVCHPYADSIPDYWLKQYKLEKQTPYYWEKNGITVVQQLMYTIGFILNPLNYIRRTPKLTFVVAGGALAKGAGRVVGLASKYLSVATESSDSHC